MLNVILVRRFMMIALFLASYGIGYWPNIKRSGNAERLFQNHSTGLKLYKRHCKHCHGLQGTAGRFDAANLQTSVLDKKAIESKIINGGERMPAFAKKMNRHRLDSLTRFVITLRKK